MATDECRLGKVYSIARDPTAYLLESSAQVHTCYPDFIPNVSIKEHDSIGQSFISINILLLSFSLKSFL